MKRVCTLRRMALSQAHAAHSMRIVRHSRPRSCASPRRSVRRCSETPFSALTTRRAAQSSKWTSRAQRDQDRIRLLVIPQYSVATDEDHAWQVAARKALDYAAIAALLEE
jgi:hypothetical protein